MRVLAALAFIALFPVVIFLASILYGGVTPQILKDGLLKAQIYEKLPEQITTLMQAEEGADAEPDTFIAPIVSRLKGSYLQEKTEKLIDDTDMWLRGKIETGPTVSFSEIKEDILAANPDLATMMNDGISDMQGAQEQDPQAAESMRQMQEFIKNDFSFPLTQQLKPLKDTYTVLTYAFPILAVLLFLCLVAIVLMSQGIKSKFKWVGFVLILAAINGFIWTLGGSIISTVLNSILISANNQYVNIVTPAIEHISGLFVAQFKSYQIAASVGALTLGAILLIGRMFVGHLSPTSNTKIVKKVIKKK